MSDRPARIFDVHSHFPLYELGIAARASALIMVDTGA